MELAEMGIKLLKQTKITKVIKLGEKQLEVHF